MMVATGYTANLHWMNENVWMISFRVDYFKHWKECNVLATAAEWAGPHRNELNQIEWSGVAWSTLTIWLHAIQLIEFALKVYKLVKVNRARAHAGQQQKMCERRVKNRPQTDSMYIVHCAMGECRLCWYSFLSGTFFGWYVHFYNQFIAWQFILDFSEMHTRSAAKSALLMPRRTSITTWQEITKR